MWRTTVAFAFVASLVLAQTPGKNVDQSRLTRRQSFWQEYLNSFPAKFDGYKETLLDSLSRYRGSPQVHLVFDAKRPDGLECRFVSKDREIISIRGHKHSSFCSNDNRLYFADYYPDTPGCTVAAYDLTTGKELWKTQLHQEQPRGASAYRNHVKISLSSDPVAPGQQREEPGAVVEVRGSETYCDYIEALDAETGASLAIKNYRVGFDAPDAASGLDRQEVGPQIKKDQPN